MVKEWLMKSILTGNKLHSYNLKSCYFILYLMIKACKKLDPSCAYIIASHVDHLGVEVIHHVPVEFFED